MRVSRLALLACLLCSAALAQAAELSASVQQHIRAATFEVVQLKPVDGDITYDRDPPFDLIPYQQRIDKYRSIGTAFAIGPNRYITASHVIALGRGSQFGPPALRDAAGKVYAIDQVYKFSDGRDFVEFSLAQQPKGVQTLAIGDKPALNETVFAVGNALGEGVIIRDGVYTSDTPEELDGRWKWLRFSAAASPGNSGGPLVDARGKVIGVVLRKSSSENLNTALPVSEISAFKEGDGELMGRGPVRLPILDASETFNINEHFALPKALTDVYSILAEASLRLFSHAYEQLLAHQADHLFPHGDGSQELLHTEESAAFPRLIHENPSKRWITTASNAQNVPLDQNGFIDLNGGAMRLRKPDNVSLTDLYSDSKLFMDLLLKAHTLRRVVGSDSVRVTSLGKAKEENHFTDVWGRIWEVRQWAIPYDDQMLCVVSLPVPDGEVAVFFQTSGAAVASSLWLDRLLTDYIYVTMQGTLAQWQEYLAQKDVQPRAFSTFNLDIEPLQRLRFHSDRFEVDVKPDLIKLSKDSVLYVDFGFFEDHGAVTWNVNRVMLKENLHTDNWIAVTRRMIPPSFLPEGWQSSWSKLKDHSFPFNGMIDTENGTTRVHTGVQPDGSTADARIRYVLTVTAEGSQPQDVMGAKLQRLQHSFKVLEPDEKAPASDTKPAS